ncbi:MAG: hypothetical protein LUE86_11845 [Clostridiales bacterium]|nr:hypothetical protein [Clostridiales bacterium]
MLDKSDIDMLTNLITPIFQRLDGIDQRLDEMDRRFDGIDQRLDEMDRRFDGIDQRLNGIDQRLDGMDQRLNEMEQRLGIVETKQELFSRKLDKISFQVTCLNYDSKMRFRDMNDQLETITAVLRIHQILPS